MWELIDDNNTIIASGSNEYISELKVVLMSEPEGITEQDEIEFEDELRYLEWYGNLIIKNNRNGNKYKTHWT